ncbi:MAG: hypothetical protein WCG79_05930 [Verrucomicrobiota bacterium]
MKIEPKRVLDIGVGFGRWGMIVREFCDVWYGRVLRKNWKVHIEGVEGFAPSIEDYHRTFYDRIHIGDFRTLRTSLGEGWDVVIFGDVLEHFEKKEAYQLLDWALSASEYVLVNIPLGADWSQVDIYENVYERHLSVWDAKEFEGFSLRRQALFTDYIDRPFGSFVLSRQNPKKLTQQLFSRNTAIGEEVVTEDIKLLSQVRSVVAELWEIKQSRSYRFLSCMQGWNSAGFPPVPPEHVRIRSFSQRNRASKGNEVWLLAAIEPGGVAIDLRPILTRGAWELRSNQNTHSGFCLVSCGNGYAEFACPRDTQLQFLTHPSGGQVEVLWRRRRLKFDLYSAKDGSLCVRLGRKRIEVIHPSPADKGSSEPCDTLAVAPVAPRRREFSKSESEWIERLNRRPVPVSVQCPQWYGIRSSAQQLFEEMHFIDDTLDEISALHHARVLAEARCSCVVIQGFPHTYKHLVTALRQQAPKVPICVIWHGTFAQSGEDYSWEGFCLVEQLCRSGAVSKWGFAKKGMAEIVAARLGIRTGFVMNMVRKIPLGPSVPLAGGPHLGLWSLNTETWRKLPYSVIAATSMVENAQVHAAGMGKRAIEFAKSLSLSGKLKQQPIEQDQMPRILAQMHLNLSVTFSECAPMLPLESLSVGAPCLLGPTSHYFQDHQFLHDRLVVPCPDNASTIAQYARTALAERDAIIAAYREYAPGYNACALQTLQEFLEIEVPRSSKR